MQTGEGGRQPADCAALSTVCVYCVCLLCVSTVCVFCVRPLCLSSVSVFSVCVCVCMTAVPDWSESGYPLHALHPNQSQSDCPLEQEVESESEPSHSVVLSCRTQQGQCRLCQAPLGGPPCVRVSQLQLPLAMPWALLAWRQMGGLLGQPPCSSRGVMIAPRQAQVRVINLLSLSPPSHTLSHLTPLLLFPLVRTACT